MRPERLVMQAFGPFAGRVEVDFSTLVEAGLFLVHGPTGAGKTSVLDAICFALYGTASGSGRDHALFRSHHAAPDMLTEVQLEFTLGHERYRVIRRPGQQRPRKRGEGFTTARAEAALYRLPSKTKAGTGTVDDEEELLVSGYREVCQEITRLLGFDENQFRQVVMLPQGEFRRFIEADTNARQEILRRLFGTEACRQLEEILRQRAADISGRLDLLRQQVDDILGRNRASSTTELNTRKQALEQMLSQGAAFRDALEKGRSCLSDVIEKAKSYREAVRQEANAGTMLKMAENAQKKAEKAQETAENALAELQKRNAERQLRARRLEEAEAMRERATQLSALQRENKELVDALNTLKQKEERLVRQCRQQEQALATARAAQTEALELQARLAEMKSKRERLHQAMEHLNDLMKAMAEHAKAAADLERADAHLTVCQQSLCIRREALEDLKTRWRKASAALLAQTLTPGAPCPVCGSIEHPAPAHHENADLPDEAEETRLMEALKRAEAALEAARHERERAAATLAARAEAMKQAADRLTKAAVQAGLEASSWLNGQEMQTDELDLRPLQSLENELRSLLSAAQVMQEATERKRREKASAAACLADVEAALNRLQAHLDELRGKQADIRTRQANVAGQLEALRRDLPADLPALVTLDEEIRMLKGWLESYDQAVEAARREKEERTKELATAKGQLHSAQNALDEAKKRREKAESDLRETLQQAQKISLPATDPTLAYAPAGKADWQYHRQQVLDTLDAALVALERSETTLDMTGLEAAQRVLDAELANVHTRLGELGEKATALEADLANIGTAEAERRTLEARAGLMHRLASLAAGRRDPKVSFETFVLAHLFEEVLKAASFRLLRMSRGRYRFERVDGSKGIQRDRRRRTGLDMAVRDAHTGTIRPIKSLSGGESFLAALALALGLADVARRHAGGRYLETLFIDEGFGSLDPEALEHAMAALADLRHDGRLIGIVSHVTELKERVPVRLAITPTPQGSRLHMEM